MDLREYIAIIRSRRLLIGVTVLVFVAVAALLTWQSTPKYAASARLFVSTSASDDTQAFQGSQFSIQRVQSYADLINGEEIAQRVVDTLHLDESPRALAKEISASNKLNTVILTITVTDESPSRAREIANATANVFVSYVADLETPPGKDEATIKATVVDKATTPSAAVSPRPKRNLVLAVLLGLIVGVGIAVLRSTLDTTIKSVKDLEDITDTPLLGAMAYDADAPDKPLITDLGSYAPRVEAFRVLRTNLQFIDPDSSRKVFIITSSVPEEGKSTTAVNLALALAEGGEKVALVEGDLRRPKISEYLNLEGSVGLSTVLSGRVGLDIALQATDVPNLQVLTSGRVPPNPAELIKSQVMKDVLRSLRDQFDIVIVDAPPLLPVTDAALLAHEADGAILVVRHGKTTGDQLKTAVERLASVDASPAGVILNMVPRDLKGGYGYGYGYGYAPDAGQHA